MDASLIAHPRFGGGRPTPSHLAKGRAAWAGGLILGLTLGGCATPEIVADLRPAYEAARPVALSSYLNCSGVTNLVCQCRREGMAQEFAEPAPSRFDLGYAALVSYREDPAHKTHTYAQAEAHAINAIFVAITADVESICSYHEEGATD